MKYFTGLMSVPSLSTLEGVKKYISAMGNAPSAIAPKQTVMLDWASKEDGTHILTITVGNKVFFVQVIFIEIDAQFLQLNQKVITDCSFDCRCIEQILSSNCIQIHPSVVH